MTPVGSVALPDTAAHLRWSPDGTVVAAASLSGTVAVLAREHPGWTLAWEAPGHPGGALCVAFSPDGRLLASGGQDGKARLHELSSRTTVADLDAGGPWVADVVWNGDGTILGAAAGRTVRFFSPDGALLGAAPDHASTVTSLHWHPVCGWTSACYGGVHFLAVDKRQPLRRLPFRGSILVARPSPDGRLVASGNQDASVRYWDLHARNDTSLTGYPGKVRVIAWSPLGPLLATGGGPDVVAWYCADRGPLGSLPLKAKRHTARVSALAFADDGHTLVSAGEDGRLCVWRYDPSEGFSLVTEVTTDGPVVTLALEPRSRTVAVGTRGGTVSIWTLPTVPLPLTSSG